MNVVAATSIAIAFAGLLCLMFGFTYRDRSYGPVLVWVGVMCMLAVIVFYILRMLR